MIVIMIVVMIMIVSVICRQLMILDTRNLGTIAERKRTCGT